VTGQPEWAGGRFEVVRSLAILSEAPHPGHAAAAAALGLGAPAPAEEHTRVLVLECHPYASVYLGAEGMLGGEAADRVAGFWRALGIVPPAEPDHLAALLGLYATLGAAALEPGRPPERREAFDRARAALLAEHLSPWVPLLLAAVSEVGGAWHRSWASLLAEVLAGEVAETPEPPGLPLALRVAPELPDEPANLDELLDAVLAPVRAGLVLTRSRLRDCAREVGTGYRQGERRFALRSMLEQDAPSTIGWLAGEAHRWARITAEMMPVAGGVAPWWSARARRTSTSLGKLARSARSAG